MVGADGGVFSCGDAPFHGSLGALHLVAPVVGMDVPAARSGYAMVGADGGVFVFGALPFAGSLAGRTGGVVLFHALTGQLPFPVRPLSRSRWRT